MIDHRFEAGTSVTTELLRIPQTRPADAVSEAAVEVNDVACEVVNCRERISVSPAVIPVIQPWRLCHRPRRGGRHRESRGHLLPGGACRRNVGGGGAQGGAASLAAVRRGTTGQSG